MMLACKAFITQGEKALFLLDDCVVNGKTVPCWDLPGGKQETGETREQTVSREIKEETSLGVHVGSCIGEYAIETSKGSLSCAVFVADIVSGTITLDQNPAGGERIMQYRWMSKSETEEEFLRPGLDEFLQNIDW